MDLIDRAKEVWELNQTDAVGDLRTHGTKRGKTPTRFTSWAVGSTVRPLYFGHTRWLRRSPGVAAHSQKDRVDQVTPRRDWKRLITKPKSKMEDMPLTGIALTIALLLLFGCASPPSRTSHTTAIARALEKRISENEARQLFLGPEDRDIELVSARHNLILLSKSSLLI